MERSIIFITTTSCFWSVSKPRGCWVVSVLILFGNPKRCQPQQPRVFEVSKHRGCWVVSIFVWYPTQPHQPRVFEVLRNTEVAGTTTTTSCFWSVSKHRWVVSVGNPKRCDFIKQKTAGCQASEPNLALQRRRSNRVFPWFLKVLLSARGKWKVTDGTARMARLNERWTERFPFRINSRALQMNLKVLNQTLWHGSVLNDETK